MEKIPLVVVCGATASGKTSLAINIASGKSFPCVAILNVGIST